MISATGLWSVDAVTNDKMMAHSEWRDGCQKCNGPFTIQLKYVQYIVADDEFLRG